MISGEIHKVDDAGEDSEGKAPIEHEANSDVEEVVPSGSEGADLDLADKTLVEDPPRGADISVIQDVAVGGVLLLASALSVHLSFWFLILWFALVSLLFSFRLFASAFFLGGRVLIPDLPLQQDVSTKVLVAGSEAKIVEEEGEGDVISRPVAGQFFSD